MIEIVLAGAPMGKQRVKFTRKEGRAYTPEKTVTFEGRLAYAAQQVMAGRALLDGQLVLDLCIVKPIPVSKPKKWQADARSGAIRPTDKPDFDNYAKIIDALNLIVWVDDAKIVTGTVHKFYGDKPLFAAQVRYADERDRQMPEWVLKAASRAVPMAEEPTPPVEVITIIKQGVFA